MANRDRWNSWAPRFIADLVHDFGFTPEQAAGFVGNFAAESAYFNDIVEDGAIAKGWAGGTGFAQWTGPRRKTFEAWIKRKGYAADSYEGNYSYLYRELKGLEKGADHSYVVPIVKAATSPENAAWRVAKYFERPKVINLAPRAKAAKEALALYHKAPVKPTQWATDNKEKIAMPTTEQPKVVISNEPAAIPWHSSPVLTGSLAGLAASVYAIIQMYKPGVPLSQQLDTLWPPTVAAIGTALAAWKRYASTAQPITGTQAKADQITTTVNTNPPQQEEATVPAAPTLPAPSVPLEQISIQQFAHELPRVIDLLGAFVPQLALLGKISEAITTAVPNTRPEDRRP